MSAIRIPLSFASMAWPAGGYNQLKNNSDLDNSIAMSGRMHQGQRIVQSTQMLTRAESFFIRASVNINVAMNGLKPTRIQRTRCPVFKGFSPLGERLRLECPKSFQSTDHMPVSLIAWGVETKMNSKSTLSIPTFRSSEQRSVPSFGRMCSSMLLA